jgi:hypothetical protein
MQQVRCEKGSILVLIILLAFFLAIPLIISLNQMGVYMIDRDRAQSAVDSACLAAANDVSRILINDPNFGFVSLSNYAPSGKTTLARDGRSLPVTGINTLVGTLRQNTIVAEQLQNQTMLSMVDQDRSCLNATIDKLNSIISESVSGNGSVNYDVHGDLIDPVEDVMQCLHDNLPKYIEVESVTLSNGWLSDGGSTTIAIPEPAKLSDVEETNIVGGNYRAFVDIPVGKRSFTFAGLGAASSLADASQFQVADDNHICSIVKIDCTFRLKNLPFAAFGMKVGHKLRCVACSQPFAQDDTAVKGAMTLTFSGGSAPGLENWIDLLKPGSFQDNKVTQYDVEGGDYPIDSDARMKEPQAQDGLSTSKEFAQHLYYWLRNGRLAAKLESVLQMLSEPFRNCSDQVYVYEFTESGKISRKQIPRDPANIPVVADRQSSYTADTMTPSGQSPLIVFRDNVMHLGTLYGGKHGGQPLTSESFKNSELEKYWLNEQWSLKSPKANPGAKDHGLAVDIEIGGTNQSTAQSSADADVASMARFTQSRRI